LVIHSGCQRRAGSLVLTLPAPRLAILTRMIC
jgi:hypothetical protein